MPYMKLRLSKLYKLLETLSNYHLKCTECMPLYGSHFLVLQKSESVANPPNQPTFHKKKIHYYYKMYTKPANEMIMLSET